MRLRRVALALPVLMSLAAGSPALAADDSGVGGGSDSWGFGEAMLITLGIALGLFVVLAVLSVLPSLARRPRYRPGRPWTFDPLWFAGPPEPESAVAAARPGHVSAGGASAEW